MSDDTRPSDAWPTGIDEELCGAGLLDHEIEEIKRKRATDRRTNDAQPVSAPRKPKCRSCNGTGRQYERGLNPNGSGEYGDCPVKCRRCLGASAPEPQTNDAPTAMPPLDAWDVEAWREDGCPCTRCQTAMSWEGDNPESADDAICHSCAWQELEALRAGQRTDNPEIARWKRIEDAARHLLAGDLTAERGALRELQAALDDGAPLVDYPTAAVALDEKQRWYAAGHLAGLVWAKDALAHLSELSTMREALGAVEYLFGSTYALPNELPSDQRLCKPDGRPSRRQAGEQADEVPPLATEGDHAALPHPRANRRLSHVHARAEQPSRAPRAPRLRARHRCGRDVAARARIRGDAQAGGGDREHQPQARGNLRRIRDRPEGRPSLHKSGGQMSAVLAGLNGWFRYSPSVASHLYIDGQQQCGIRHSILDGLRPAPKRPDPSDLTRHGEPYGKTCSACLKVFRRRDVAPGKPKSNGKVLRSGVVSHRRIAKMLGVSHATVMNIERRALAKMRALAEERGFSFESLFEGRPQ
jgi:hypothetical protein